VFRPPFDDFSGRFGFARLGCAASQIELLKTESQQRTGAQLDNSGTLSVKIGGEMAHLVLDCDGVDVITHELIGDVITIGRAPSNDVVIDDPTVSTQHASLTKSASGYRLKD
jgi:hypothetical protein